MSRLSAAPLIEAIVEVRWGAVKKNENIVQLQFPPEESTFFPGQFRSVATNNGFSHIETINTGVPLPHLINYRFRRSPNVWPCYQIGQGIFTVNQLNEGYDWDLFRGDVLQGFRLLDAGHPKSLLELEIQHIELRYTDGFYFEAGETPTDFLRNKMNFSFSTSPEFLQSDNIEKRVQGYSITFNVPTIKPPGLLIFVLRQADINGRPGFVMDTIMRSKMSKLTLPIIESWLEDAHSTQKHAFETLINPTYMKSFK